MIAFGTTRKTIVSGSLTLAATIVGLLLLEIGLRLFNGEPILPYENLIVRKVALLRVHTLNQYDPLLGWVLKENQSSQGITTGQYGIRMNSKEVRTPPRGGVLATGDSFTAGSEVEEHQTWPALLEAAAQMPVNNAATGAWGSDQIILRAEQLLPVLSPKIVIVSFLVDDIERSSYRIYGGGNKPYFEVVNGQLVARNNPVPPFSGRPDELGWMRSVLGYSHLVNFVMERIGYRNWWRDGSVYEQVNTDVVAVSTLLMKRLKDSVEKKGGRLIFILQYGGGHIATWKREPDYATAVLENYRKMGVETVNTWQPLKDVLTTRGEDSLKQLFVMRDGGKVYGHMSEAGNRFVAELLAGKIRQRAPIAPKPAPQP